MPSRDSIAMFPSNHSHSNNVWYDKLAVFSTRGEPNIYHNSEWIANFYHMAANIEKFPLVDYYSIIYLDFRIYNC